MTKITGLKDSTFQDIVLRALTPTIWEIREPLACVVIPNVLEFVVPVGFQTNLASIPRPLWWVYPPHGSYTRAAIVHDYSLHCGWPEDIAHAIFDLIMKRDGVNTITRTLMYNAVRIFCPAHPTI